MSEPQLKRALADKEKSQDELNRVKNIIKVSEACEGLVDFVKKTPEPFGPDFTGENPWLQKGPGTGCPCIII